MGKKIALMMIVVIIAIGYYAFQNNFFGIGNFFGTSFESGFAQIGEIDSKYGIGETALIPANADETQNYISELGALKTEFESGAASREKSALALLVESKINAADAQKGMIEGAEAYRRMSKVRYECGEGETAMVAREELGGAMDSAHKALSLHGIFIENYADFAETAEMGEEDISALVLKALSESAEELIKYIDAYCNIS